MQKECGAGWQFLLTLKHVKLKGRSFSAFLYLPVFLLTGRFSEIQMVHAPW